MTTSQARYAYQVSGVLNHTNFLVSEAVDNVINATFQVVVADDQVYVRIDYASGSVAEWSYDGTNDYCLQETGGPRAAATVYQNEYPISPGSFERTVWLGLGSAHYFGNPTNEPILAPFGDWALDGMLSFRWNMKRMAGTPGLPDKITFVASEELWQRERSLRMVVPTKAFPYHEGFIGGRFEVKATNLFNGLSLPSHFILERFRIGENKGAVLTYTDVQVTNISTATAFNFRPKIMRGTDISDMRSSTRERPVFGITYTVTTDDWWIMDDPRRLMMIERQKPRYEEWRGSIRERRWSDGWSSIVGLAW